MINNISSAEYLSKFYRNLNTCYPNMSFLFQQKINGKFLFLDLVIRYTKLV